ncbi:MAG TPA: PadR family transcriptional regulator [Anaerolineales bacterium]|nr:PadR family transcriptional regulator [Anaerolineales bacterium]
MKDKDTNQAANQSEEPRNAEHGRHRQHEHMHEHAMGETLGHHGHGERNFWSEWRDEHHPREGGDVFTAGHAFSHQEMQAWREFFHESFHDWPEEHWIFGGRRFSPWHQGIESFNPFAATLLSKGGGLLPLYVLSLINQAPRYGNEIMEALAERTHGQWVANPGAIYPLLALLEKKGFIEGKWEDPDKRTIRRYTITPAGQEEVAQIKSIVMPKLTETVQVLQEIINDLQPPDAQDSANSTETTNAAGGQQ